MMYTNDYFDEVYCINQFSAKDRWRDVSDRFRYENIYVKRVEARTPKDKMVIDSHQSEKGESPFNDPNYNIKTMAAYYSHLDCIADAIAQDYDRVLIFEDDIIFNMKYSSLFLKSINNLPKDCDIWLLGGFQHSWDNTIRIKGVLGGYDSFYESDSTMGMFAYALSREGMREFKRILDKYKESNLCIDSVLGHIIMPKKLLNVYVSHPMLVGHNTLPSITQDGKSEDYKRFFPVSKFRYDININI